MGVAVKMTTKGVPTVRVVVVDGPPGSAAVVDAFDVSAPQEEFAGTLAEIAEAVASRAKGLGVDRTVVRRADKSQRPSNKEGPRLRLLTEGAVAAALRVQVPMTVLRDGVHAGSLFGSDRDAMDAAAATVLAAGGTKVSTYQEAAGAALAGLNL